MIEPRGLSGETMVRLSIFCTSADVIEFILGGFHGSFDLRHKIATSYFWGILDTTLFLLTMQIRAKTFLKLSEARSIVVLVERNTGLMICMLRVIIYMFLWSLSRALICRVLMMAGFCR